MKVLNNQLKIRNPGIKLYNSQYMKTSSEPLESIRDLNKCLTEYTATTPSHYFSRNIEKEFHTISLVLSKHEQVFRNQHLPLILYESKKSYNTTIKMYFSVFFLKCSQTICLIICSIIVYSLKFVSL